MQPPIRIAIVGMGKIAHDQHLPAVTASTEFTLAATVDPVTTGPVSVPHFASLESLLKSTTPVDAIAICTPPQIRHGIAACAIARGLHVLLEKPPCATVTEAATLSTSAQAKGVSLFAAWHSRFATGVEPARLWLKDRKIESVSIVWREDVRVWHPGQDWIWQPGGLGVFDPGINALSIATHILPHPVFVRASNLAYPANRAAPIAADILLDDATSTSITLDLDWRQLGPQSWDIQIETDAGVCQLTKGGSDLSLPGESHTGQNREYANLYTHFAHLIKSSRCDVDLIPMQIVADAFLLGIRQTVEAFEWEPQKSN